MCWQTSVKIGYRNKYKGKKHVITSKSRRGHPNEITPKLRFLWGEKGRALCPYCCKCSTKDCTWIAFPWTLGRLGKILRGKMTRIDLELQGHRTFVVLQDENFWHLTPWYVQMKFSTTYYIKYSCKLLGPIFFYTFIFYLLVYCNFTPLRNIW